MLLVTFHGGTAGINNVYCYDTVSAKRLTDAALRHIDASRLSELRALVYCNGYLYVANSDKSISNVLTFQHESQEKAYHFAYIADFVDPTFSHKGDFKTSIAHPFSLAFDGAGFAYVSNQDTNVVAQLAVSANFQTGTLGSGCQSLYLQGLKSVLCPNVKCVFLDGTFVASQQGKLDHVDVAATDVAAQYGGLAVSPMTGKVQNSVRDVLIANGMLFVCDEPSKVVRIYSLPGGDYLGASTPLPASPTHLAVQNGGLHVSAGAGLYWSPLPAPGPNPVLTFQAVLSAPASMKIGGIAFDQSNAPATAYVCFQAGTGAAVGGAIETYSFTQSSVVDPPAFTDGATFASSPNDFQDTPEFVVYLADTVT